MFRRRYLFLLLALAVAALIFAPGAFDMPTQAQNLGTNWQAQFYPNTTFSGTPTSVVYPGGISFNWGLGPPLDANNAPVTGMPNDNFSARFTSLQAFPVAGNYTFRVLANDGVRVTINGNVVLSQLNTVVTDGTTAEYQFTQTLAAGNVSFVVEYVEFLGSAALQFQWSNAGQVGPTSTPTPIATVSVVRVRGLAVRTGPYLGASLITVARPNIAYPVLARNNSEGLFVWYRIQVGDNVGWASGRYLQTSGNIEAIPFTDSLFDRIDAPSLPPALDVIGTTRAIMNMRVRPSERVQIIDKIPWGDQVKVIGRTIQGGNNFWLHVEWNGRKGWIFAPFIGLRGTVDALPTY
jgi:uncharacterized protein YraI